MVDSLVQGGSPMTTNDDGDNGLLDDEVQWPCVICGEALSVHTSALIWFGLQAASSAICPTCQQRYLQRAMN